MAKRRTTPERNRADVVLTRVRAILLGLFLLSGATGLIYEVVWTRMFGLIFGNTVFAVSTVLSAFMGGLALGSFYFGRLIDRKQKVLQAYALLECGIGIFALVVPFIFSGFDQFYAWVYHNIGYQFFAFGLLRFLFSFAILLIPTTLMGGTLPVLTRFFVSRRVTLGKNVGNLYAVNTIGAVVGTFLAGFYLLEHIGMMNSIYLAAVINLIVAGVVLIIARTFRNANQVMDLQPSPQAREDPSQMSTTSGVVLWAFFVSGFAALSYEVFWTRVLVFLLGNSTYAFSIMLLTFLIGIALGSLVFARLVDRLNDLIKAFSVLEICIGGFGVLSIILLGNSDRLFEGLAHLVGIQSWWQWNTIRFLVTALIMLAPTLLMGATFPVVAKTYTVHLKKLGKSVGSVYSMNTVGGVGGSFIAGFVLMPLIGAQNGILVAAGLNVIVGIALLLHTHMPALRTKLSIAAAIAAVLVLVTILLPSNYFVNVFNRSERGSEIVYCDEGISGTVTVHQYPDYKVISINGVNVAGTSFLLRTTQKLQGHIPPLLHPNPKKVMQVGFGTGETGNVVSLYGVERIDGVEISAEVIRAGPHFTEINGNIFERPVFRPVIMDGKNYALLSRERYDLIMNDSIHPSESGNASLYTLEYFQSCRERLKDDGLMSSWFPIFALSDEDFRMIVKTFHTVFPHCTLWVGNNCLNRHALLVGWKKDEPFRINFERIRKRLEDERIRQDLDVINMGDPYAILDALLLDEKAIATYVEDIPVNTDDLPLLEYGAPKEWGGDREIWARNLENAFRYRSSAFPLLIDVGTSEEEKAHVKEKLDRYYQATTHVIKGQLHSLRGMEAAAMAEFEIARRLNPDDRDAPYLLETTISTINEWQDQVLEDPENAERHLDLANYYLSIRNFDKAIEHYQAVVDLGKGYPEIYTNLGLAYYYKRDSEHAKQNYQKAIEVDPNFVEAHYNLGLVYSASKDGGAWAISEWKRTLELDPQYTAARFNLGLAYLLGGDSRQAVVHLEKVIKERPGDLRARQHLAAAYANSGQRDMALEQLNICIERTRDKAILRELKRMVADLQR